MAFIEHKEELQTRLIEKKNRGEKVESISDIPLELWDLLKNTIITQWNCEQHGGMNYLNCLRLGIVPKREEKIVAHIGKEELGHAAILEAGPLWVFRVNPWEQFVTSVKDQKKILRIFQYPERFTTWAHFLMFNHLQDRSAAVQLAELKKGPFGPLSEAIGRIEIEEEGHITHGENGIRELVEIENGREDLQRALDDWLKLALDVFGAPDEKSKSLPLYKKYGFKESNDATRALFKNQIKPLLYEVGLTHPALEGV